MPARKRKQTEDVKNKPQKNHKKNEGGKSQHISWTPFINGFQGFSEGHLRNIDASQTHLDDPTIAPLIDRIDKELSLSDVAQLPR